jgi:hypothetical protein
MFGASRHCAYILCIRRWWEKAYSHRTDILDLSLHFTRNVMSANRLKCQLTDVPSRLHVSWWVLERSGPPLLQAGNVTGFSRSGFFEWGYAFTPPLCLNGMYGTNFPFVILVVGHVVRRYTLRTKMDFFSPRSWRRQSLCWKNAVCSQAPPIQLQNFHTLPCRFVVYYVRSPLT